MQPGAKPILGSGDREETVIGLLRNLSLEGLGPQWIRPFPPRLPVQEGEVRNVLSSMTRQGRLRLVTSALEASGLQVNGSFKCEQ